jgi:hypothetical protein
MADVLSVAALEFCNPVALRVVWKLTIRRRIPPPE